MLWTDLRRSKPLLDRKQWQTALTFGLILLLAGCSVERRPPEARIEAVADTFFGHVLTDNYQWLRDDNRRRLDVIEYLEAENAYSEAMLEHTTSVQNMLHSEMVSRMKETDQSVPVTGGDHAD